jgi:hypothetical protein
MCVFPNAFADAERHGRVRKPQDKACHYDNHERQAQQNGDKAAKLELGVWHGGIPSEKG